MTRSALARFVLTALFSIPLWAQPALQIQKAELSLPFGSVHGKLLTVGEYLVFIDDEQPDASFSVARRDVKKMALQDGVLTLELGAPVRDRSGSRSQLSLRMATASALDLWYQAKGAPAGAETPPTAAGAQLSYEASHNHRFRGECTGKLMITEDRVIYESVGNAGHSRQWRISDIKEMKQKNPYEIELEPFVGDQYTLKLVGQGMDSADFQKLSDRVIKARVSR